MRRLGSPAAAGRIGDASSRHRSARAFPSSQGKERPASSLPCRLLSTSPGPRALLGFPAASALPCRPAEPPLLPSGIPVPASAAPPPFPAASPLLQPLPCPLIPAVPAPRPFRQPHPCFRRPVSPPAPRPLPAAVSLLPCASCRFPASPGHCPCSIAPCLLPPPLVVFLPPRACFGWPSVPSAGLGPFHAAMFRPSPQSLPPHPCFRRPSSLSCRLSLLPPPPRPFPAAYLCFRRPPSLSRRHLSALTPGCRIGRPTVGQKRRL